MDKNINEFVQRIQSCYVCENGIQIMVPHRVDNPISILNSDGFVYYSSPNSGSYINKYLSDPRRKQFPYSDIPTHIEGGIFNKIERINQILDFNRAYIVICDTCVFEQFAIKDGDEALLVVKSFLLRDNDKKTMVLNSKEFEDLWKSANLGVFNPIGSKLVGITLPINDCVLNWYKQQLINETDRNDGSSYFYKAISRMTIDDVPRDENIRVCNGAVLVSSNNNSGKNEIDNIKYIGVGFMGPESYETNIYEWPVSLYDLDYAKYLEQHSCEITPEPKGLTRRRKIK